MIAFAAQFDPQPFHLDEAAAKASLFGALSASGWHTAAGWMKCYVATNQAAEARIRAEGRVPAPLGPSPGFENLVWHRPVTPGDRLELHVEKVQSRANVWKFAGKAIVEGQLAAEATFAAMIRHR